MSNNGQNDNVPATRRRRARRVLPSPPLDTGLFTDKQLEERTGVPAGSWRGWRSQGKGPPFVRLGTRGVRYRWQDVETFLQSARTAADGKRAA